MSNYGVFSGPHFPAFCLNRRDTEYLSLFSQNAGKYRPEKPPYLDIFHTVRLTSKTGDVTWLWHNFSITFDGNECNYIYYILHYKFTSFKEQQNSFQNLPLQKVNKIKVGKT